MAAYSVDFATYLGALPYPGADDVTLADTAANIASLTNVEIAALAGNGIDFIDGMNGMIVGESSHIRLTTDGGATWTYSSHWNPGMNLTKADMANATQITCLFSSSPYWANVGNSWNSVVISNLGYTQPYNDLWFNNGVGYVVGLNGIAKTNPNISHNMPNFAIKPKPAKTPI